MSVFECRMCGRCCEGLGGIVLSAKDLDRVAEYMGLSPSGFSVLYAEPRGGKLAIRAGEDGFCVFFKESGGCAVHPGRPDICRAWPFFRGNLVDAVSLEMAATDCPGIRLEQGFEEFRRQGLEYLRKHGLIAAADDSGTANALKIKDQGGPLRRY